MIDFIFNVKKQSIIALFKNEYCYAANYADKNLKSLSDIPAFIIEFSKLLNCNPGLYDQLLSLFSDAELISQKIYYNKSGISITDPVLIIKCSNILITCGTDIKDLYIAHSSTVNELIIKTNCNIDSVNVGSASIVSLVKVEKGGTIQILTIYACNSSNAEITKIDSESFIANIGVEENAIFGGFTCEITEPIP